MIFAAVFAAIVAALPANQLLVETTELPDMRETLILDARDAAAYEAGHIPGAVNLDVASLSEEREGVATELKPLDEVASILAEKAVDPKKHIIVYSQMHEATDLKNAARLFWILEYLSYPRVSVLNGGYAKWAAEKRQVETGQPAPVEHPKQEWQLKTRPELLATKEEVYEAIESRKSTLIDLRSPSEYAGLSKKDFVAKSGHIPGACNLPATDVVEGPYFTLKRPDSLKSAAAEAGAEEGKPVITYCNSGRDAATGYLALRLMGRDKVSLYDGSMSEWALQQAPAGTQ